MSYLSNKIINVIRFLDPSSFQKLATQYPRVPLGWFKHKNSVIGEEVRDNESVKQDVVSLFLGTNKLTHKNPPHGIWLFHNCASSLLNFLIELRSILVNILQARGQADLLPNTKAKIRLS